MKRKQKKDGAEQQLRFPRTRRRGGGGGGGETGEATSKDFSSRVQSRDSQFYTIN